MKPGRRTTEFISTVALCVALAASALAEKLSPHWAAVSAGIAIGAYAISRGIAKNGTPGA